MRVHFKALESYSTGSTATQAAVANRVELIQMLFDGLIDSLSAARGHIEHNAIEQKSKSLARAGRRRSVRLHHHPAGRPWRHRGPSRARAGGEVAAVGGQQLLLLQQLHAWPREPVAQRHR